MSEQAVAIVTGSGSGIGRAAAVRMVEAGYVVVMVGRTESLLCQTAELVADRAGAEARTLIKPADVTDPDQVNEMVAEVLQRFNEALDDLRAQGAEIVDPVHIELLENRVDEIPSVATPGQRQRCSLGR